MVNVPRSNLDPSQASQHSLPRTRAKVASFVRIALAEDR
jgi:hypothetical protein